MSIPRSRLIDVGGVASLAMCGAAVLLGGLRPIAAARAEAGERLALADQTTVERDAFVGEIAALTERLERVRRETVQLHAGDALAEPAHDDQTAWLVGAADTIGVRLDRLRPSVLDSGDGPAQSTLSLGGAGRITGLTDLLARLRIERPHLELRTLSINAGPLDGDTPQVLFEAELAWSNEARTARSTERQPGDQP